MSEHISDLKYSAFVGAGYGPGHISDMVHQYLTEVTGLQGSTNDLWDALCDIEGIPPGALSDRKHALFSRGGYTTSQARPDVEYAHWLNNQVSGEWLR